MSDRKQIARGKKYQYRGFPSGFIVKFVSFRGHPEDDGAFPGVAVKFFGPTGNESGFYPCNSQDEFFSKEIFKNAYEVENETKKGN